MTDRGNSLHKGQEGQKGMGLWGALSVASRGPVREQRLGAPPRLGWWWPWWVWLSPWAPRGLSYNSLCL